MRISDWGSDVCSSDLPRLRRHRLCGGRPDGYPDAALLGPEGRPRTGRSQAGRQPCGEGRRRSKGGPAVRVLSVALLVLIRGYQLLVSTLFPPSCRYFPSCPEHARSEEVRVGKVCVNTVISRVCPTP